MLTYHVQHARYRSLQPILLLRNSVAAAIGLCSSTVPSTCRRTPASPSLFTTLFQFINVVSSRPFHFNRLHGRRHRSHVCAHLHHHPAAAAAAALAAASCITITPVQLPVRFELPLEGKSGGPCRRRRPLQRGCNLQAVQTNKQFSSCRLVLCHLTIASI